MTARNFINEDSYSEIMESVKCQEDFEYRDEHKKFEIKIGNGYAGCDWSNGVKDGDYIVSIDFQKKFGDMHGVGCAYSVDEFFKIAQNYQSFLRYVDKGFLRISATSYIPENCEIEQLRLSV